jgi:hypothetical protein
MSGRTDQDGPPAAHRYETEERELQVHMALLFAAETQEAKKARLDETMVWLDRTLYEHRQQARAEAFQESFHGTWWDRNWFGLAFLGLVAFAMLMIGLINGWS